MPRLTILALLFVFALVAASCGGGGEKETFIPGQGNSELVVGPNRIAIPIRNQENDPLLGGPANHVELQFKDAGGALTGEPQSLTFIEAIPDTSGFWVLNHTFDTAGEVPAVITVTTADTSEAIDIRFRVTETGNVPAVGMDAPPTENPTLTSQPNRKQLTTDSEPNDAFYEMTVTQALAADRPFVVVFATPAFCTSRLCGPILDNVKALQPEFVSQVNFIHVEPFILDATGNPAEGNLKATQSATDWRLQTEPWVFVVGADGKVSARFEGSASPDELRDALQAVV